MPSTALATANSRTSAIDPAGSSPSGPSASALASVAWISAATPNASA